MATSTGTAQTEDSFTGTFMVADEMAYDPATGTIEARGNVDIYNDGVRLTAPSVVYDGTTDRVAVGGPFTLHDEASGTTTFADFADLSGDMQDFILITARHVMQDQLQISADQMERREGRFTEWRLVTASYCQVCADNPTPLWELRAQSATHDQQERMIYLRNAQFRVAGVPIAYTPYLRMPDPTVERATGLISASARTSTLTGTTLRLPYFIVLGDHADLTVTPNLSFGGGDNPLNTVEARYRQSFAYGEIEFNGAVSRDDLTTADARAYLFGNGQFSLQSGFDIAFQIQTASDRTYLSNYNFFNGATETFTGTPLSFNTSTLTSSLTANRIRSDEIITFSGTWLDTLQPPNVTTDHPSAVGYAEYSRWFTLGALPGDVLFSSVGQAEYNEYGPTNGRQRDIERVFTGLRWSESWSLQGGFVFDAELAGFSDIYRTQDDAALPPRQRTTNSLAVATLRWPWERTTQGGTRHSFEPFLRQIAFAGDPITVPSVDGTIDDFDPANRFDLGRFRRLDRSRDLDATEIGFDYMIYLTNGWSFGGRAERDHLWNTPPGQYDGGALYTTRLGYRQDGFSFDTTQSFNSEFFVVRETAGLTYRWESGSFGTSYTRIGIDPDLATTSKTNLLSANLSIDVMDGFSVYSTLSRDTESTDTSFATGGFALDTGEDWTSNLATNYSIDDAEIDTQVFSLSRALDWGGTANLFYDYDRDAERAFGLGLDYVNECVNLQSELTRRQSVITDTEAALEFTISVEFGGFSQNGLRRCG